MLRPIDHFRSARSLVTRFARDEEGGIIVMTLLLLIVMLVMGGMAVDFMRFESERAELQSVADRAVLAAAELDQDLDSKAVVNDFFLKAGYANNIIGEPIVEGSGGNRSVRVNSEVDVNTFYLRLIGIDTLTAPARSSAVEGTGNVEVSLILDISWSMRLNVPSEGKTRIQLLRDAAEDFIDDLLLDDYAGQISVNLIPYSQQVRLGDELFNALNRTPPGLIDNPGQGNQFGHTNTAQCIDFEPILPPGHTGDIPLGDFGSLSFNTARTYQQVEHARHYTGYDPVCPDREIESVITVSQNRDALKTAIRGLEPSLNTSIHLGMKWGVTLLDPSMRDVIAGLPSTDPAFAGQRPADYNGDSNTVKYVILMTDGENFSGPRIRPEYYDTAAERAALSNNSVPQVANAWGLTTADMNYTPHPSTQQDTWLQSLCELAKPKMTIYTIAMGAPENGVTQMQNCASQPSFAFTTNFSNAEGEKGIDEIFETIAKQITALRLSL